MKRETKQSPKPCRVCEHIETDVVESLRECLKAYLVDYLGFDLAEAAAVVRSETYDQALYDSAAFFVTTTPRERLVALVAVPTDLLDPTPDPMTLA